MHFNPYYDCQYNQYRPVASNIQRDSLIIMKLILISRATASLFPCSATSLKYPCRKQKHNIQAVKWRDCSFQNKTFFTSTCLLSPRVHNNIEKSTTSCLKVHFCCFNTAVKFWIPSKIVELSEFYQNCLIVLKFWLYKKLLIKISNSLNNNCTFLVLCVLLRKVYSDNNQLTKTL